MGPEQLAQELRRIAAAIDNSKKPSRTLVAKAIRELIGSVEAPVSQPGPSAQA